jgi:hypothetical protein
LRFFCQSYFESETKLWEYFSGQHFPPTVKEMVLQDKTIVPYWCKCPDQLIQLQQNKIISVEQLVGLKRVDFMIGSDWRQETDPKILFRFENLAATSNVFQIGSVSQSKDDLEILHSTVLHPIGDGARLIAEGGHFLVNRDLSLSFLPQTESSIICSIPNRLLIVGDHKFYAQMLGRENMSGSWCMWCKSHPSEWHSFGKSFPSWMIESLKSHKDKIIRERLKEPREICGVVSCPVWYFVEPSH